MTNQEIETILTLWTEANGFKFEFRLCRDGVEKYLINIEDERREDLIEVFLLEDSKMIRVNYCSSRACIYYSYNCELSNLPGILNEILSDSVSCADFADGEIH